MVDPLLLPFTMNRITTGNLKSVPVGQYYVSLGRRFGTGKYGQKTPEKIEMARNAQHEALKMVIADMDDHIQAIVRKYTMYLMRYWFSHVDQYFNRSSHARYYPSKIRGYKRTKHVPLNDLNRKRQPHKMSTKSYQLRHALRPTSITAFGSRMFVFPCFSKSKGYGSTDYVTILILGASAKFGNHYVPDLNKRMRGGMWGGISAIYWRIWYNQFNREVQKVEDKMNLEIKIYINGIMKTKNNKVLFNTEVMRSPAKLREFKTYNSVRKRRLNADDEFSDIFKDDTEYSKSFNEPIDTREKPTWETLIKEQQKKRAKMRR
jgi:hypothetical protein